MMFAALLLVPVFAVKADTCEDYALGMAGGLSDNEAYNTALEQCYEDYYAGGSAAAGSAAAGSQTNAETEIKDPLGLDKGNQIPALANRLITAALGISGVLALLAFVYGGILYMLAGVNPKNVEKGKEIMKYAVMGLFVIFSSYAVINFFLKTVLGVPGA